MEKYFQIGVPGSYGGVNAFATASKISPKGALELLQSADTYTKFKPLRRRFQRRKIIAYKKFELMQADLADMQSYSKQNNGNRYILVVIDVLSKFTFYVPVKSKTHVEMKKAFKKVFDVATPKFLNTDQGLEFTSREMQQYFKSKNVKWYHTFSELKAAVVERQIRTLKEKLERIFHHRGSRKYVDILSNLAEEYNRTPHSRTKIAPLDVNESNEKIVFERLYGGKRLTSLKPIFKVGDQVRVYRKKSTFSKGYEKRWTDEVFTIARIKLSDPIVYYVKDINGEEIRGAFYREELNKVIKKDADLWDIEKVLDKRKRKDGTIEYLVKWMGYGPEHNSWVTSIQNK